MRELNGHQLLGAFRAGADRLRASESSLNDINVFPVPDGDTGTNMAVTITRAVEGASVSESVSATAGSMGEAAIAGARGNSGAILAQFLSGFGEALHDTASMSMERFAHAIEHAYLSARAAIANPREGTILSVIREWSAALRREHREAEDFRALFRAAAPSLRESLAATTGQLEILRRAGVVDAGASGFVAFIDGAHAYLESEAVMAGPGGGGRISSVEPDLEPAPARGGSVHPEDLDAPSAYRYCAEFLLAAPDGSRLAPVSLRSPLAPLGDSLVVAGSATKARIHLHTDRPDLAMAAVSRQGWVLEQKVDDMARQRQDAHARVSRVALVTDSSCDLPLALLDRHRIHVAPLFIRFGEREYLDRLTMDAGAFYDLADVAPVFPTSSQPSRPALERLYRSLLARYDRVVAIHLSAALSGTFEVSRAAAAAVDPGRVAVVDSRHLSGSLGLILLRAATWLEAVEAAGMGADEAAEGLLRELPSWSEKAENLVSVRTLRFMVRGGRVSPLGGALARILNLKPIVSVDRQGRSKLHGAAFSVRSNLSRIVRMAAGLHERRPLLAWAVVHAHAPEAAVALAARLEPVLGSAPVHVSEISAVVGMNAGRGALSVVTMSE